MESRRIGERVQDFIAQRSVVRISKLQRYYAESCCIILIVRTFRTGSFCVRVASPRCVKYLKYAMRAPVGLPSIYTSFSTPTKPKGQRHICIRHIHKFTYSSVCCVACTGRYILLYILYVKKFVRACASGRSCSRNNVRYYFSGDKATPVKPYDIRRHAAR